MGRNLDTTMAPHLADGTIGPAVMVELYLKSGIERVWSGIGDLVWNSKTFTGVGNLGSVGAITEASAVKAEGTTVTLSGIGVSSIAPPPSGLTPPVTVPAGWSVAWATPRTPYVPSSLTFGNGGTGLLDLCTGSASWGVVEPGHRAAGSASYSVSRGLGMTSITMGWGDFELEGTLPAGAVIQAIYPVALYDFTYSTGVFSVDYFAGTSGGNLALGGTSGMAGQVSGGSVGTSLSLIETSAGITAKLNTSLFDNHPSGGLSISGAAFAVYYIGGPAVESLIYEALNDVRLGAPAKIWFGLMSGGAFIGNPYLVFAGTVDKPTVLTSPEGSSITLALENRLVNLQRPTNRRYTSADQHLSYPTDLAFNWVEILNDIALVWGN